MQVTKPKIYCCQAIDTIPIVINYALRFPSELRPVESGETWKTNFRISDSFVNGPRLKHDFDGGVPPGYIRVTNSLNSLFVSN